MCPVSVAWHFLSEDLWVSELPRPRLLVPNPLTQTPTMSDHFLQQITASFKLTLSFEDLAAHYTLKEQKKVCKWKQPWEVYHEHICSVFMRFVSLLFQTKFSACWPSKGKCIHHLYKCLSKGFNRWWQFQLKRFDFLPPHFPSRIQTSDLCKNWVCCLREVRGLHEWTKVISLPSPDVTCIDV